jgi:GNAT superfamily N-acetyltransferase
MTKKLYCYVDESGQDTRGKLFVVSVVVTAEERDDLTQMLEQIERETGKGHRKWHKAGKRRRLSYIERVLKLEMLRDRLNFALYYDSTEYLDLTTRAIVSALENTEKVSDYKATILIDALPDAQVHWVGTVLRRSHIRLAKVRGVRLDENNPLIRLADALCGFVRDAFESDEQARELFARAVRLRLIKDVTQKKTSLHRWSPM